MKIFWVVLVSTLLAFTVADLIDGGFNTRLNHFDQLDSRLVHFPYQINLDYYNAGGPLFFYLNDDLYSNQRIQRSLMVEVAREANGALITTHTRYFGLHRPTEDASLENLQYLTWDQGVYDIAYFIQEVKNHLAAPNARVIVFGIMWGGSIAVHLRQKFPFLVDGAWSTSGIFKTSVFSNEFYDYLEDVIVQQGGVECGDNLRIAFQQIHNHVVGGNSQALINNFALCEPWDVTSEMNVGLLFESLTDRIELRIRRNHFPGLMYVCGNLTTVPNDPYTSFGNWIRFEQGVDLGGCLNYDFTTYISQLRETDWDAPGVTSGARQSFFLRCAEGGRFHTTNPSSIFGNHISQFFHYERCNQLFAGSDFQFEQLYNANMARAIKYGSLEPRATRVIFTNGELDAWFPYGITEYNETDSLVFNIPNYAQSADIYEILPTDSEYMAYVKQQVFDRVLRWATGAEN